MGHVSFKQCYVSTIEQIGKDSFFISWFWGEGFDWFDMKRWGDPIIRNAHANGGNFLTSLAVTINPQDKNKWTWSIPLRESDYNKGLE
ncbi:hypothetical protein [Sphingobacterium sp. UDSM-2020]|uniref:hypothetical protein n=1 Tax=Sphingobacterium sp. UDSM-2020 TaxID=2795738 RepID=UPI001E56086A|nr:hypothetical protein [Sphingobacterium sp. UDSM-2020]